MGVPGFFAWLLKNYKKSGIIIPKILQDVDNLYIDANCLFHPQCNKVLSYYGNKLSVDKLENKMIKRILNYLDYLITYVNPKKKVFVAVDGVAPMAKMNQQRKRRYKSVYDNKIKDDVKNKYGKEIITIWNNSSNITPGTKFMEKLHLQLINYFNENRLNLNIKYTYSSYHTVGEGEHKILQDIKNEVQNDDVYVVYGLDADLIFLSLACGRNNMYLLREETFLKNINTQDKEEILDIIKDVSENLNYVSIDETKNCINYQIEILIKKKIESENISINNINFINDFIIICYFIGNDFIPNLPSIEIKNDGLDFLLENYVTTVLKLQSGITYIDKMNNVIINNIFFENYVKSLAKFEEYYFKVKFPNFMESIQKRQCQSDDNFDKEIWNIDNMRVFQIIDPIKLGYGRPDLWKFRYYEYYYGSLIHQKNHIANMCNDYLKGIMWTLEYYFKKCSSYNWQYKYYNGPFISDLSQYLKESKLDINSLKFSESKLITPFIQLLSVLPPSYSNLLPKEYGILMCEDNSQLIDMYPSNIKIDILYKDSFHKCNPLIPNIDLDRVINAVKNIKLTNEEKQRNLVIENLNFDYAT